MAAGAAAHEILDRISNINPSTRFTENVNTDLNTPSTSTSHISVAIIVHVNSGPPLVVERPMYFNFGGIQSGTDVVGTTTPGTAYYFAEADTRQSGRTYYTFVSILNPSDETFESTVKPLLAEAHDLARSRYHKGTGASQS